MKPEDPDGGTWILAFRGTSSLGDWADNALQALFGHSAQYEFATALAERVRERLGQQYPAAELLFAGHSLGGGLASAAAYRASGRAITFNTAGPHPWYRHGDPVSIRNHFIPGEWLSTIQGGTPLLPGSVGERIAHPVDCSETDMVGRHSLDNFSLLLPGYCATPDSAGLAACEAPVPPESEAQPSGQAGPEGLMSYQGAWALQSLLAHHRFRALLPPTFLQEAIRCYA